MASGGAPTIDVSTAKIPSDGSVSVAGLVHRDPHQPGSQGPRRVKPIERSEGSHEDLLGYVFGVSRVSEQKVGQSEDRLAMALDDRLPSAALASLGPADQLGIRQVLSSGRMFRDIYTPGPGRVPSCQGLGGMTYCRRPGLP